MILLRCGLFTPSGAVQCYQCHGEYLWRGTEHEKRVEGYDALAVPQDMRPEYGIGHCNRCGESIQVRHDIAQLQRLGLSLQYAGPLDQTGGMTPGLSVACPKLGIVYVVTNLDDTIMCGVYPYHQWLSGDLREPLNFNEFPLDYPGECGAAVWLQADRIERREAAGVNDG